MSFQFHWTVMDFEDIDWEPVKVIGGNHKGKITDLDNCEDGRKGIQYAPNMSVRF